LHDSCRVRKVLNDIKHQGTNWNGRQRLATEAHMGTGKIIELIFEIAILVCGIVTMVAPWPQPVAPRWHHPGWYAGLGISLIAIFLFLVTIPVIHPAL
jgi:hypothetical protein